MTDKMPIMVRSEIIKSEVGFEQVLSFFKMDGRCNSIVRPAKFSSIYILEDRPERIVFNDGSAILVWQDFPTVDRANAVLKVIAERKPCDFYYEPETP